MNSNKFQKSDIVIISEEDKAFFVLKTPNVEMCEPDYLVKCLKSCNKEDQYKLLMIRPSYLEKEGKLLFNLKNTICEKDIKDIEKGLKEMQAQLNEEGFICSALNN